MMEQLWVYGVIAFFLLGVVGCSLTLVGMQNFHWIGLIGIALVLVAWSGGSYCNDQRPFTITPAQSWDTIETQNISSLSGGDAFSIHGSSSFILGSGSATIDGDTRQIYTFFKQVNGGYQKGTIGAENVIIKEDEQTHPYIEWDYSHATTEGKTYNDLGYWSYDGRRVDKLMATYIHVPNGTIVQEFKA